LNKPALLLANGEEKWTAQKTVQVVAFSRPFVEQVHLQTYVSS